ncbi:MAG: hydrogenase formation protein HypD [Desulfurococcaceae archaeon]
MPVVSEALRKVLSPDPQAVERILGEIRELARAIGGPIRIMNFCGTHEHTIARYGIRSLMPENVELIAGPGCPVCVTPGHYVDLLVQESLEGNAVVLTYGDTFKLPGTRLREPRSLYDAAARGGRVKVVYSFFDAVKTAASRRDVLHIFFAVGFETTMPATAVPLATGAVPDNLVILSAYRLTPPIMRYLLERHPEAKLDGIIAPGHVSTVIGWRAWEFLPREYGIPTAVAGFEPLDVLLAILAIIRMKASGRPSLVNEYKRSVRPEGNVGLLKAMEAAYEAVDSHWRGIGIVPLSGATHRREYRLHDYFARRGLEDRPVDDRLPGCICDRVVLGLAKPTECPMFLRACTPRRPYGPCMVSVEGTCRIWAENLDISALASGGKR